MKWLLAGGSGMIGRALCASLIENGHEVIVLSRNPNAHRAVSDGLQLTRWDGASTAGWAQLIESSDVVVNMTGERIGGPNPFTLRWTPTRKKRICDSRANAGKALLQAIENAARKPAVLVQFSGVDYYPPSSEIATEETPRGDGFLARVCAECWEPSTQPAEQFGVRRLVLRLGSVLHPKNGALPPLILQTRLFLGGPLGSGKQFFSWVHIDDVIGALRFLVDQPHAAGVYNLTAPNPVTNAEFMHTLGRVMRRPSFLPVPAFVLKLIFGEMATILLQGPRVSPRRLISEGFTFRFPQVEAALQDVLERNRAR